MSARHPWATLIPVHGWIACSLENARPLAAERLYDPAQSAVFCSTWEAFGGFSNIATDFPLEATGRHIRTTEALHQACRFPHPSANQRAILEPSSPMTANANTKSQVVARLPHGITVRTWQAWEQGERRCPPYAWAYVRAQLGVLRLPEEATAR